MTLNFAEGRDNQKAVTSIKHLIALPEHFYFTEI